MQPYKLAKGSFLALALGSIYCVCWGGGDPVVFEFTFKYRLWGSRSVITVTLYKLITNKIAGITFCSFCTCIYNIYMHVQKEHIVSLQIIDNALRTVM